MNKYAASQYHFFICIVNNSLYPLNFTTRTDSVQENARTNSRNKELDSFLHSHKCAICHGNTQHAMDIQHILLD